MNALVAIALAAQASTAEIAVRAGGEQELWSVRARSASPAEVLAELAARSGRELAGLGAVAPDADPIAVELVDRPLAHVVHCLAGAAGLRARVGATSVELLPLPAEEPAAAELDEQEALAWERFLRAFPRHELAGEAEFALGALAERAGDPTAAVAHYERVASEHPRSLRTPDALLAAGLAHARAGRLEAAGASFGALAGLDREHPHHARARLELARTIALRGDGRQAGLLLDALDRLHPARDDQERSERFEVRARALLASGKPRQALDALAAATALSGVEAERVPEDLLARIYEALGRPGEASRAWLASSRDGEGDQAARALAEAARLAHAAGDDLAVLFLERRAHQLGCAAELAKWSEASRARLGLATGSTPPAVEEVELAEQMLAAGNAARARPVLERVWRDRRSLDPQLLVRAASAHARATSAGDGLEAAIAVVRAALEIAEDAESVRALHVLAGELFEAHERFDDAARAYGGEL